MTSPVLSASTRAVFLSYASQDREAARRICDALRQEGVEVWFDQDGGLEHGDVWDAKIRRQIRECVLFIPLISANTQARHEGYFRIEWDLAAERAQGIAQGIPFILPVLIDDTLEAEALVPDRFRRVQWTRLPGGVVTLEDKARFLKLWSHRTTAFSAAAKEAVTMRPAPAPPTSRLKRVSLVLLTSILIVGSALWLFWHRPGAGAPPAPEAQSTGPAQIDPKSLVVLPFENLSPDPKDAFFTEGLHSEIIATLSRLQDLKVISRNSALAFKNATISLSGIAEKLRVANVMTGSVRRERNSIRIQLELRRASDETVLWNPVPFEQPIEDAFSVQTEIANAVARVLEAREATGTAESARLFTKNIQALELFFKAKEALYVPNTTLAQRRECVSLLEQSLKLDPAFWYAAGYLSVAHSQMIFLQRTQAERTAEMAAAKHWADEAIRLAPPGLGGGALAYYYIFAEEDPARGLEVAKENVRALPGDAERHNLVAYALETLGRPKEALAEIRAALEFDPFNASSRYSELNCMLEVRHAAEWEQKLERFVTDFPVMRNRELYESLDFRMRGRFPAHPEEFPPDRAVFWNCRARQFQEAVTRAEAFLATPGRSELATFEVLRWQCIALQRLGRTAEAGRAAAAAATLERKLAADHTDPEREAYRASWSHALLGQKSAALEAARRNVSDVARKNSIRLRWDREEELARLCAFVGDVRGSVEIVKHLLQIPSGLSVPALKADPEWDPLRADAEFKALLKNPNNIRPM